jgi:hypothetical protein
MGACARAPIAWYNTPRTAGAPVSRVLIGCTNGFRIILRQISREYYAKTVCPADQNSRNWSARRPGIQNTFGCLAVVRMGACFFIERNAIPFGPRPLHTYMPHKKFPRSPLDRFQVALVDVSEIRLIRIMMDGEGDSHRLPVCTCRAPSPTTAGGGALSRSPTPTAFLLPASCCLLLLLLPAAAPLANFQAATSQRRSGT